MMKNHAYPALVVALFIAGFMCGTAQAGGVSEERVKTLVQNYLEEQWGSGMVLWEPKADWPLEHLPDDMNLQVIYTRNERPRGNTILMLQLRDNGRIVKSVPLSVRIYAFARVPMYQGRANSHEEIDLSQIAWRREEITTIRSGWPESPDALTGRKWWAKRPVREGDLLTWDRIAERPAVVRGEPIELRAELNGVTVTLPGEALEHGHVGERIRVKNALHDVRLSGRVTGTAEVLVDGYQTRTFGASQ
ncbi:flagellar basal body P-ring formation protein FlgA [bacterium]|nr:flagellar basal body P-ring formation protein FlgA [bacterium]